MSTELHLVIVDGKVDKAAPQLEELFARVAVFLVLLDGVRYCLLGQTVLQLEGGYGQPVDEEAQVQGKLGVVLAVVELPRHAEAVLPVLGPGLLVPRRRCAVHEIHLVRPVLDSLAKHVDGAPLGDLPLKARYELAPRWAALAQVQWLGGNRLGVVEEGGELGQVYAVLPVVILWVSADPAYAVIGRTFCHSASLGRLTRMAGHGDTNEPLKSLLSGVCGHAIPLPSLGSGLLSVHRGVFRQGQCESPLYAAGHRAIPWTAGRQPPVAYL